MSAKETKLTGPIASGAGNSKLNKEFGSHFLIELIDCPPDRLAKVEAVKETMAEVVEKSNSNVVKSYFHQFQPAGVTGMILIQESHFAIHTWPEEGYAAADIFTCGQEMDPYIAIEVMKDRFAAGELRYQVLKRGY